MIRSQAAIREREQNQVSQNRANHSRTTCLRSQADTGKAARRIAIPLAHLVAALGAGRRTRQMDSAAECRGRSGLLASLPASFWQQNSGACFLAELASWDFDVCLEFF